MIINRTTQSLNDTSFHGQTFKMSKRELVSIFGEPTYYDTDIRDKTQNEWELEIENTNIVFSIYDWKEYRAYGDDEIIEWHIGSHREIPEYYFRGLLF